MPVLYERNKMATKKFRPTLATLLANQVPAGAPPTLAPVEACENAVRLKACVFMEDAPLIAADFDGGVDGCGAPGACLTQGAKCVVFYATTGWTLVWNAAAWPAVQGLKAIVWCASQRKAFLTLCGDVEVNPGPTKKGKIEVVVEEPKGKGKSKNRPGKAQRQRKAAAIAKAAAASAARSEPRKPTRPAPIPKRLALLSSTMESGTHKAETAAQFHLSPARVRDIVASSARGADVDLPLREMQPWENMLFNIVLPNKARPMVPGEAFNAAKAAPIANEYNRDVVVAVNSTGGGVLPANYAVGMLFHSPVMRTLDYVETDVFTYSNEVTYSSDQVYGAVGSESPFMDLGKAFTPMTYTAGQWQSNTDPALLGKGPRPYLTMGESHVIPWVFKDIQVSGQWVTTEINFFGTPIGSSTGTTPFLDRTIPQWTTAALNMRVENWQDGTWQTIDEQSPAISPGTNFAFPFGRLQAKWLANQVNGTMQFYRCLWSVSAVMNGANPVDTSIPIVSCQVNLTDTCGTTASTVVGDFVMREVDPLPAQYSTWQAVASTGVAALLKNVAPDIAKGGICYTYRIPPNVDWRPFLNPANVLAASGKKQINFDKGAYKHLSPGNPDWLDYQTSWAVDEQDANNTNCYAPALPTQGALVFVIKLSAPEAGATYSGCITQVNSFSIAVKTSSTAWWMQQSEVSASQMNLISDYLAISDELYENETHMEQVLQNVWDFVKETGVPRLLKNAAGDAVRAMIMP